MHNCYLYGVRHFPQHLKNWSYTFDQSTLYACVEISQCNSFVQLIYTNKNKGERLQVAVEREGSFAFCLRET
jgi:hypothetical protein